ncbi:MAG TPA: hypothetical protein VFZ09_51475 [Archangium sp.]|uniref:hypothetical protein n=1 Tax=Archangium sp. TaxID=1872627 RepID=UPI002E35ED95|nr:hypothetical protein [Archangium sp.]HEX5754710.1 hypothetical protein [Archangium sp.]
MMKRRDWMRMVCVGGLLLGGGVGCDLLQSARSPELKLPTRFVEKRQSAQAGTLQQALTSIQGLYFGELELVAYDYRPGVTIPQTGQHFGGNGTRDWSYWVVLQSGHDAARDNVLQPGQQIDISALDNGYSTPPEQDFVDQVGSFDIDLFEVYLYRTGVISNNTYYGMNADGNGSPVHPLHKYPALASLDDHFCAPEFPGQPSNIQDVNVFFVRSDWFPRSVVVNTRQEATTSPPRLVIDHTSIPLTPDQESLVLSLVNNGTQRRFYSNLLFIPFSGPVSVDLTGTGTPVGGGTTPAPHHYVAGDFRISVNFDLSDIIDESATDLSVPRVRYKGDAQHVPFGLSVSFDPL